MTAALRSMAPDARECCAACGGPLRREEVIGTRQREAIEARVDELTRRDVRSFVADVRGDIVAVRAETAWVVAFALAMVRNAGDQRRVYDPPAERRALGWLLSGRARAADFAGLEVGDWSCRQHAWVWAVGLEMLVGPERTVPSRARLARAAALDGYELGGALESLPWPAECPALEIELVTALGRRWRA